MQPAAVPPLSARLEADSLCTASDAQARAVDDAAADGHARSTREVAGKGDLAMEVVRARQGEAPQDGIGARRDERGALMQCEVKVS
jgi:hypothetical protein